MRQPSWRYRNQIQGKRDVGKERKQKGTRKKKTRQRRKLKKTTSNSIPPFSFCYSPLGYDTSSLEIAGFKTAAGSKPIRFNEISATLPALTFASMGLQLAFTRPTLVSIIVRCSGERARVRCCRKVALILRGDSEGKKQAPLRQFTADA